VSRGPGDAALEYSHETQGDPEAFRAKALPPGAQASKQWQRLGERRVAPTAQPRRDDAPGSAGDEGAGEGSWRRRVAPRHREVLRRFFGAER
jgi:hypothetical protein